MLTYDLEKRGDLSYYDYLYRCIKNDILNGVLTPDEKLPSKRNLAEHLGLSVVTVESAYAQLIAEGYIYALEKRGYFVAEIDNRIAEAGIEKEAIKPIEEIKYEVDFKSNSINAEYFPFSVWSKLMREVLSEQSTELLKPMPVGGLEVLRRAIAGHLRSYRGMNVDPEQIIIGAGTEYLYNLIIQLLGKDKVIALENPGYSKIAKIYQANGVECRYVNLDRYGISMDELEESDASIVHISPAHHFPTGIVTSIGRRHELLKWAEASSDRYIIEDDYDSEFRFTGKPIQTIESIDRGENVIYTNTFTKSISPSLRISYMVLPAHLLEKFRETLGFYSCPVSSFEQFTLAKFIEGGYFEKHINRLKTHYRTQRDEVITTIRSSALGEHSIILEEDSGLHFLLRVGTEKSDAEITALAAEKGIRISCLSEYLAEPNLSFEHFLITNYSGIDTKKLPWAIKTLEEILF